MTTSFETEVAVSGNTQWAFNEKREPTDKQWARAFWTSLAIAAAAGTYTWLNRNPLYDDTNAAFLRDAANCPMPDAGSATGRSLLSRGLSAHPDADATGADVLSWVGGALLTAAVAPVLLSFALLLLFERAATFMVYASLVVNIALVALPAVLCLANGELVPGVLLSLLAALLCWGMYSVRDGLKLVARLLSVAADGLKRNKHLVSVCLGLTIVVGATVVPLTFGWIGAAANGTIVANGDVTRRAFNGGCLNADWKAVNCCEWQQTALSQAVMVLLGLVWLWATAVIAQIKVFIVAGSITQWYFSGECRGTTLLSLRHATTVNFGSICFSAALLTLCNFLRSIARQIRCHRVLGAVAAAFTCIFSFVIDAIAAVMRAVTQFATVEMAATGEPFLPAARSVIGLLMRQGLDSYTIWWLPQFVLTSACVAVTIAYVCAAWIILALAVGLGFSDVGLYVFVFMLISAFFGFWSLSFTANILKNVVDTVYVCWAHDLENGTVSKPEVHAVYADLPKPAGAVVVQPDAAVMYGAMEEGAAGPPAAGAAAPPLLDEQ